METALRLALLKLVEKALVHAVWRWNRASTKRLGVTGKLKGATSAFSQWFGLNLPNDAPPPCAGRAVACGGWRVVELPLPEDEDVESVLTRLLRQLRAALAEVEGALPEDEYEARRRRQRWAG